MRSDDDAGPPAALPWNFDTTSVWRTILKGAFGLNAVLVTGVVAKLLTRAWFDALGVAFVEATVAAFTIVLVRRQEGARGTLFHDHVEIEPNIVLGVSLPGPRGSYQLSRFRAVHVESFMGAVSAAANAAGPHELVRLLGKPGGPSVVVARTRDGAGREFGQRLAALLDLSYEESMAPGQVRI